MVLRFFLFASIVLLISCSVPERDSPYDPKGNNYQGDQSSSSSYVAPVVPSSSSVASPLPPSSSSKPSSSSAAPPPPPSSSSKPSSSSAVPVVPSSSSVPTQSSIIPGPSVSYGGETYKTVKIGTQIWMARNLNYDASGSKCHDYKPANCDKYGKLYDWATAMALDANCNTNSCAFQINPKHQGICPDGWHIPNNADWDKLVLYVDGANGTSSPYNSPTAGRYLKATGGWNSNGNGDDTYGFPPCRTAMLATTATGGAPRRAVPTTLTAVICAVTTST
ncbi:MAG: hypothetical protein FWF63_04675 [Fibromonadales bacterium]|nr:hypothetical protein [Fibromonadales bacterium]